jgi:hypothetical protein
MYLSPEQRDALQLVYELARQNTIDDDAKMESFELFKESQRQNDALELVYQIIHSPT